MTKGMNEGQKVRTRVYLDDFKENNGGCVICQRKASDFYFNPVANESGHAQLMVYASCAGHAMMSKSDEMLEQAVTNLIPNVVSEAPKPILMIVTFNEDGEEVKYASPSKTDKIKAVYTSND